MTDTVRAYAACGITAVVAGALIALAVTTPFAGGPYAFDLQGTDDVAPVLALAYLFAWPVYCFSYVLLVWRAHSGLPTRTMRVVARRDARARRSPMVRWFGEGGAVSSGLTVSAAAVVVTVIVAQSGLLARSPLLLVLAFLTVGGSWIVMMITFALEYLRLNETSIGRDGARHLTVLSAEPYRFDDYVTIALLASTMAATISVHPGSREGWRLLRANVAVAFAFNSVVIAMTVSLLIGGLGGA